MMPATPPVGMGRPPARHTAIQPVVLRCIVAPKQVLHRLRPGMDAFSSYLRRTLSSASELLHLRDGLAVLSSQWGTVRTESLNANAWMTLPPFLTGQDDENILNHLGATQQPAASSNKRKSRHEEEITSMSATC